MPKWSDFGNIWSTLRELDVNAIRDEAERSLSIACVGTDTAINEIDTLLHQGPNRYPKSAISFVDLVSITHIAPRGANLSAKDLLIVAIDVRTALRESELEALAQLDALALPVLVVLLYGDRFASREGLPSSVQRARMVAISDLMALDAADRLGTVILSRLPTELHLAAARNLPGLRAIYARDLIASTAFTNATYSLASGLPEQIPLISIPFAAADILVLTKNQAMMVYRLALAYGAPPEFQARIREVLPVIGGAFLWRQAARSLIGLIPIWGLVPKIAIAYAGTYTTGVAAWRWFERGEMVSTEQLKRISQDAIAMGRARASEIIERARTARHQVTAAAHADGSVVNRLKHALPLRRKPRELNPPE